MLHSKGIGSACHLGLRACKLHWVDTWIPLGGLPGRTKYPFRYLMHLLEDEVALFELPKFDLSWHSSCLLPVSFLLKGRGQTTLPHCSPLIVFARSYGWGQISWMGPQPPSQRPGRKVSPLSSFYMSSYMTT